MRKHFVIGLYQGVIDDVYCLDDEKDALITVKALEDYYDITDENRGARLDQGTEVRHFGPGEVKYGVE